MLERQIAGWRALLQRGGVTDSAGKLRKSSDVEVETLAMLDTYVPT